MGEIERDAAGWTVQTLKQYVDQRLIDSGTAVQAALAAAEKAVEKAEKNAEKWRENANEWRGAMSDRERNFATNKDLAMLASRADEIRLDLGKLIALSQGGQGLKNEVRANLGTIIVAVMALIALWRVYSGH
jgi:hypothetical protein